MTESRQGRRGRYIIIDCPDPQDKYHYLHGCGCWMSDASPEVLAIAGVNEQALRAAQYQGEIRHDARKGAVDVLKGAKPINEAVLKKNLEGL